MPKMSGIALIQQLKRLNQTVKIIAISGLPANREPVMAAGADVFLAKPYAIETLLKKIHQLMLEPFN
jgi:DNA-binding response OmpR family regulator